MGRVYQRGRVWWIEYRDYARQVRRESSGSEKKQDARNLLRDREGDSAKGVVTPKQPHRFTFAEAAERVLTNYRVNGQRSIDHVARRIRKHLLPYFGQRPLITIGTDDVERYVQHRQTQLAEAATINRELAILKRAFTLAIQAKRIGGRPYIPMLREDNARTGFFEAAQFESVMGHLPADIQPVIHFAYITGWRIPSEVLPLLWRQVSFVTNEVRLDPGQTKNREPRVFPITMALRRVLEAQNARREALCRQGRIVPHVFFRENGQPIRSLKGIFKNACVAAGCPGRIPHDFRRTAVRNLIRQGVSQHVAMQMTGHLTPEVFRRYNIVSEADLRDAARKLSEAGL